MRKEKSILDKFLSDTKDLYNDLGLGKQFSSSISDKRHYLPPKVKVIVGSW